MCAELSRMGTITPGTDFFDRQKDEWGYSHGSGTILHLFFLTQYLSIIRAGVHITGRIVLNVWRILRSELKLQSYSYQSVAYHVLHKQYKTANCAQLFLLLKKGSSTGYHIIHSVA